MDNFEDFLLFFNRNSHRLKCLSGAAVGADQRSVVLPGKGRMTGVGLSADWAGAYFVM